MTISPSIDSLPLANMLTILKLFLIPVGGGIPAGVLFAQTNGVLWPFTALLYLLSDILLAIVFEPILRLVAMLCSKNSFLTRISIVFKTATARSVAHFNGTGAGPLALIMIAFGVDPMTGRASALAAGHGFITGWAIAIAGDMLYFTVIAISTLQLNSYIKNPNITMVIILVVMFAAPMVVRYLRSKILMARN